MPGVPGTGSASLLYPCLRCPSFPWSVLRGSLVSNCILPFLPLWSGLFSTCAVESLFCQSLSCFLLFTPMWVLSRCSHASRWAKDLSTLPSSLEVPIPLNLAYHQIRRSQSENGSLSSTIFIFLQGSDVALMTFAFLGLLSFPLGHRCFR